MGEVIRLTPRQQGRPRPPQEGADGAQILLFLGVRYERHEGAERVAEKASEKAPAKRGRGRKRA